MRSLDLSHNNISTTGFLKIVSRLKKSTALLNLNVSHNDFSQGQEKFATLQKFLYRTDSCRTLNMSGCKIKDTGMSFIGQGIADNRSLAKLSLSENENISRDGLTFLMKGMLDAEESKLIELDL